MKKGLWLVFLSILFVTACSNNDSQESAMNSINSEVGMQTESSEDAEIAMDDGGNQEVNEDVKDTEVERKIIYTANLHVEVKDYQQGMNDIESEITAKGGYIVETSMHENEENASKSGVITARVPQEHFQDFLQFIENGSFRVIESSTSGQDVTEEYVDLEARLKSKRVVEERLISFMEQAEKTEDLLKISNDLAKVQEEIEQIVGRMNYLNNKVDLATITIYLEEKKVTISDKELNTWERTVEQFMNSINILLSVFSGLIVFLVGGLPILLPIVILVIGFFFWRRRYRKKKD